jgi:hypothetical protein
MDGYPDYFIKLQDKGVKKKVWLSAEWRMRSLRALIRGTGHLQKFSDWKIGFWDSAICFTFSKSCIEIDVKFIARSKAMRNNDSSPGGIAAVTGWLRVKVSPNLA